MSKNVTKRTGELVPFDREKIEAAARRAVDECLDAGRVEASMVSDQLELLGGEQATVSQVADMVIARLQDEDAPSVEAVQDAVVDALACLGLPTVADAYARYRDRRARVRAEMRVRYKAASGQDVTDQFMLVDASADAATGVGGWSRERLSGMLEQSLGLEHEEARDIAKETEDRLVAMGGGTVSEDMVREMANSILADHGHSGRLQDTAVYTVPRAYVRGLMGSKVCENSNVVANNPEAVSLSVSDMVLKQFALDSIFDQDVREAYHSGRIYIHDLGFPHRLYCSSHSLEYLKLYGLKGITTLSSTSLPAKSASVLTGHLNTFIASMQAYYAGALGLGFVNVFYAPMVTGKTREELHQLAQEFVFSLAQNAFSRGGQTLFTDANVSADVPAFMRSVPAVCPGGKYVYRTDDGRDLDLVKVETPDGDELRLGDVAVLRYVDDEPTPLEHTAGTGHVLTYGDFRDEARAFAHALLDVWAEGDATGKIFEFPKCDFHVSAETFTDPESVAVYEHACRLAATNGSTYFVFDRDAVSLASCCFVSGTGLTVSLDHGEPVRMDIGDICATAKKTGCSIRVRYRGKWREASPVVVEVPGDTTLYQISVAGDFPNFVDHMVVTGDHVFLTPEGQVMARDIRPGTRLLRDTEPMSWREPEFGEATYETGRLLGALVTRGVMGWDTRMENSDRPPESVQFAVTFRKGEDEVVATFLRRAEAAGCEVVRRGADDIGGSYVMLNVPGQLLLLGGLLGGSRNSWEMAYRRLSLELASGILDEAAPKDGDGKRALSRLTQSPAGLALADLRTGLGEYTGGEWAQVSDVSTCPAERYGRRVYCLRMADGEEPYFTLDSGIVSHNCRLRVQITDRSLVTRPERLRTVGFQNVTINVPQAAYRASRAGEHGLEGTLRQIGEAMDLAVRAHLQKKAFSESLMGNPTNPLWQLGKPANDGRPYVRLEDATYIIGIIGVNDAVHHILGKELHESEEAMDMALRIVGFMYLRTKEYTEKYGLTFKLEESPAESAARKLAKADLKRFREEALKVYKGGDEEHAYYTNSVHVAADAPVDLFERIRLQSRFNGIIEAGAITHAFIGEESPSAEAIASVVRKVLLRTQCAQLTFSPEFTFCQDCGRRQRGLHTSCDICGSGNVEGETRIVGYFSRISNFNLSKLAELRARQHGRYRVETAGEDGRD